MERSGNSKSAKGSFKADFLFLKLKMMYGKIRM